MSRRGVALISRHLEDGTGIRLEIPNPFPDGAKTMGGKLFPGAGPGLTRTHKTLSERGEMRDCRFGLRFLIASSHFFDPNGKKLYLNWKARDCRQNLLRIRFSLMRTETPETLEGWGRFDPNGKNFI